MQDLKIISWLEETQAHLKLEKLSPQDLKDKLNQNENSAIIYSSSNQWKVVGSYGI